MITKLTLSVEKDVVEKAKRYAKKTGRSLSEIIQGYLETLTKENDQKSITLSPKLRKIVGVVKLPKNFNEEKAKRTHLENKHL